MITGRLQEKNGRYYMVLNLRGEDGKWKPKWISTGLLAAKGNKRKADNILRETINEYEAEALQAAQMQTGVQQEKVLLVDYLSGWLKLMKAQVEGSTFVSYRRVMERVMLPYFEPLGLYLHELEAKHIKAYYDYLQIERGNSANTVKHHHANLRKALKTALITDLIPTNPADKVEVPKIKPHVADIYNKQELEQLFQVTQGTILELPVVIAAYYGLRRSEVMGLRWDAIDFEKKTITINHIVVRAEDEAGNMFFQKRNRTKNKSSFRTLPLVPAIEEKLLQKKARQEEYRQRYGKSYRTDNLQYVNTGRLGFLAAVSSGDAERAVQYIIDRKYERRERRLIRLKADGRDFPDFSYGLNEVGIHKTEGSSMLKIHAYIGEIYLTTYWADGLVIATPTGSTAYSLSGGGPIVNPECRNFILTPVCPHNLTMRSLVVPDDVTIRLKVESRAGEFTLSLDSRMRKMKDSMEVEVTAGAFGIEVAHLPEYNYYETLRNKLGWGEDKRNN